MPSVDWRQLYAENQATIARASLLDADNGPPSMPGALPSAVVPPLQGRWVRPLGERSVPPLQGRSTSPLQAPWTPPPSGSGALVHIPPGLDPSVPTALVCMLHGCTQNPASFAAATAMNDAADRDGFVVVYPGQSRGRNPQGCWNWFLPEHQQRGAGEPEAVATILREVIEADARCCIDPDQVFVAGLSSGGAMALVLATCYPDLIAGVAVHSGLAYGSAKNLSSALEVMAHAHRNGGADGRAAHAAMGRYARPVPSLVIHGSADRTVSPANAIQVLGQSMLANHLAAPATCNHDVRRPTTSRRCQSEDGYAYTQARWVDAQGTTVHELLAIDGLGHAWSGGTPGASYTEPRGPSATEAICAFFSRPTVRSSRDVHGSRGAERAR